MGVGLGSLPVPHNNEELTFFYDVAMASGFVQYINLSIYVITNSASKKNNQ